MDKHKIFADFHNADEQGRLRLTCLGTVENAARLGIRFHEGMTLVLSDEEVEVEGTVAWNAEKNRWVAAIDWDAIRNTLHPETDGQGLMQFPGLDSTSPDSVPIAASPPSSPIRR